MVFRDVMATPSRTFSSSSIRQHELTTTGAAPLRAVPQRLQRKDKAVPHDIVVARETNNAILQVRWWQPRRSPLRPD
jgi:hypothetical protein